MRRRSLLAAFALPALGALSALATAAPAAAQPSNARPTLSACALGGLMQREVAMRRGVSVPADTSFERRLSDMASPELDRVVMLRRRTSDGGQPPVHIRLGQRPGWIGVQTSEVSNVRESPDGRTVLYCDYPVVVSVEPGSPAQRGGLEAGDTVVAYNGRDLRSGREIPLDQLLVPNDTLRVSVRRDGRPLDLAVVVAPRPATAWSATGAGQSFSYVLVSPNGGPNGGARVSGSPVAATAAGRVERTQVAARVTPRPPDGEVPRAPNGIRAGMVFSPMPLSFGLGTSALAGAQLVAIDDDLGAVIGTRSGVLVLKVAEGTPASAAGLRAGDVITVAAGRPVATPVALQQSLVRRIEERALPLRVVRKGKARDVTLRW